MRLQQLINPIINHCFLVVFLVIFMYLLPLPKLCIYCLMHLQVSNVSHLNFEAIKHKRALSKKGSIAHRKKPSRAAIHAVKETSEENKFTDSTGKSKFTVSPGKSPWYISMTNKFPDSTGKYQ